jgi:hypothetical protein
MRSPQPLAARAAVVAPLGAFTYTNRVKIVPLALKHRLPGAE